MGTTTTKPAWYQTSVTAIDPAARSMLENYSGLKPEEVIPHFLALVGTDTHPCFEALIFPPLTETPCNYQER